MIYPPLVLIDSGILTAYYSGTDNYHLQVCRFLEGCTSRLITGGRAESRWL